MQYKKWLLPLIIVLLISVLATSVYASNNMDWKGSGKKINNELKSPEKAQVIAKIDGSPVTLGDLKTRKVMLSFLRNEEISNREAMEQIKKDIILAEEAKKRNISVSREDTLKFMRYLQNQMEESLKNNPSSVSTILDYMNGLGMTKEEFWNDENVIENYQNGLVVGKLRNKLTEEWGYSNMELSKPEKMKEFENKLNNMISERKSELNVEITSKDILE